MSESTAEKSDKPGEARVTGAPAAKDKPSTRGGARKSEDTSTVQEALEKPSQGPYGYDNQGSAASGKAAAYGRLAAEGNTDEDEDTSDVPKQARPENLKNLD